MLDAVTGADNDPSTFEYEEEPSDSAITDRLNLRARALVKERSGLRSWRGIIVFLSAATPMLLIFPLAILIGSDWGSSAGRLLLWMLCIWLAVCQLFLLIVLLFVRARVANLGSQLAILEYEHVLTSFDKPHERRAANLFFKHQAELKQYYDQTLRQNRQSFVVGMLCIAFGLAVIVAVATLLLGSGNSATAAKLAAGGLGILSVLLTGFVARIYLRVYEGSAEALGSFHERLVNTNDYHFASLLISTIEPKDKRMLSQSDLARAITASRVATETED